LVLVDDGFGIVKRFDVAFPAERTVDLTWSADERFVVCRVLEQYESVNGTAVRIYLATGQETPLGKCSNRDQFVFMGKGGELVHVRVGAALVWGFFDGELGTRVSVIEADGTKRKVFGTKRIRKPEKGQVGTVFPPMIAAPDGSYIAAAVPRPESQAPGAHYHLVDLKGDAKPFAPVSDASYITPYYPIAFAEGGGRMIARSGSTLFSLPVSAVAETEEAKDD
jgi:hypothetical protein